MKSIFTVAVNIGTGVNLHYMRHDRTDISDSDQLPDDALIGIAILIWLVMALIAYFGLPNGVWIP